MCREKLISAQRPETSYSTLSRKKERRTKRLISRQKIANKGYKKTKWLWKQKCTAHGNGMALIKWTRNVSFFLSFKLIWNKGELNMNKIELK